MKIFESVVLSIGVIGAITWTIVAAKDGFKQNNAMIIARSIDIASTIDGEVENDQLEVGTPLGINDLMIRIRSTRIDRSRAIELNTKLQFLKSEIANTRREQSGLRKMLGSFEKRSMTYAAWLLNDLRLKRQVKQRQYVVSQKQKKLRSSEARQIRTLVNKKQVSIVTLRTAITKVEIADNQVQVSKAELGRNDLMLKSVENDGIFFDGGDTSYWRKTVDALNLRLFDNKNKIAQLRAQIVQYSGQETVELKRLKTDFVEEHRAPFAGFVNAVYVAKGARVKSGTTVMQILDCSNPVIVIPIPELRLNDFSIGQKVTVNPIDSSETLSATIKYISSGALINQDKSIALPQTITARGSRAVVTFDKRDSAKNSPAPCVTARRAIVTIHMQSMYDTIKKWVNSYLKDPGFKSASSQIRVGLSDEN